MECYLLMMCTTQAVMHVTWLLLAFQFIQDSFGAYEFLPNNSLLQKLMHAFCSNDEISKLMCTNAIFAITGFNWKSMNISLIPVILGHFPAGGSTKQFIHFGQEINSGRVFLNGYIRKWL